jgi:hypothetical protein
VGIAVARREGRLVAPVDRLRALLPELLGELDAEVVAPSAHGAHEPRLDLGHVVVVGDPLGAVDDVVDSHEHGLREMERPVHVRSMELVHEDPSDAFTVLRVEAVAGEADQTRHEAVERVRPDEQPQPLALAQPEDAHRGLEQLVRLDLEQ